MTILRNISMSLVALMAPVATGGGYDILWHVDPPPATFYSTEYSVVYSGQFNRDTEVSDDFQATGLVQRIEAPGRGCWQCQPSEALGVYVRFYEWTPNGPGALQYEAFIAVDSGNFEGSATNPGNIAVNLTEPFMASGWHFYSLQMAFADGGFWNFKQTNRFNNINAPLYYRNNLQGGVWAQHTDGPGNPSFSDLPMTILGQAGETTPSVTGVSRVTVTGSDRIIVSGDDFGAPGDGRLLVNGVEGLVMEWSSTQVIGYVPEGLAPGAGTLVIENLGVPSAPVPITVTPREPNGRIAWVFEGSGSYLSFSPTTGPDGTLYFSDVDGWLYAMSPDGALLWIVDALLGQEGSANEAPVQVDADGTVYVATNPLGPTLQLVAFHPDGSHRWTATLEHGQTWQAGPTIGPDGRLYAAVNSAQLLDGDFDVLAFRRDGGIDWTQAADPYVREHAAGGARMIFGPSSPGGPVDQLIFTADRNGDGRNWGFMIDDGAQNFATPTASGNDVGQGQLAKAAFGGDFYMFEFAGVGGAGWGLQAFDANGNREWRYDPGIASGATLPVVGPDGVIYFAWDGLRMTAVAPDGDPIWIRLGLHSYNTPAVSPAAPILIAHAWNSNDQQSVIDARRTDDGEPLWEQTLVDDEGAHVAANTPPQFTPDGAQVYFDASPRPLTPTSVFRLFAVRVQDSVSICEGDANADNEVNFTDLNAVLSAFGQTGAPGFAGADLNADGVVNFMDLNAVLSAFGSSCG